MPEPNLIHKISFELSIEFYDQHANIKYRGETIAKFTATKEQQGYVGLNEWGILYKWKENNTEKTSN